MMHKPLSQELNDYILSVAPPHFPSPDAPDTLEELQAWAATHTLGVDPLPVLDSASETSIYGDPAVNHAYRAWHDAAHLTHGLSTSLADELEVALLHVREAKAAGLSAHACQLLLIDSQGQNEYYARWGEFVQDQRAFAIKALRYGITTAIREKI